MIDRIWRRLFWPAAMRDADRLFEAHKALALHVARHAVAAARERSWTDEWSRVLHEVERRSGYRPW